MVRETLSDDMADMKAMSTVQTLRCACEEEGTWDVKARR
jgi:hypothetical protein